MNETLDKIDLKIIKALDEDSRQSLNSLSADLGLRKNAVYRRIDKMLDNNIIQGYSSVFDLDSIGITIKDIMYIELKNMLGSGDQNILLESFCSYLVDNYPNIHFSAADGNQIWIITGFSSELEKKEFMKEVRENPYVSEIESVQLTKMIKGSRLFSFVQTSNTERKNIKSSEIVGEISAKDQTVTLGDT